MKCWIVMVRLLACSLLLHGFADAPKAPHWAFQPVRSPEPPPVTNTAWCRTPLDRFILSRLEADQVLPAAAADRRTLIRRASFDLTGLPPSADEVDAFVADASADAFERLVDRLLDSPRYGEHWGRHWLDVVRYADTAGETADYPVPVAWRYRNYVIDAFNADKPYDQFLREQIAGDILARRGPRERYAERVTATGFLAISRRFGFDSENYHHLTIQDTIDTVGQSVLGLTLGCARCHAHKFDPVSMPDYYALYGIFDSTRYAFPGSEQKQKTRVLVPLIPPEESQPQWAEFESRIATLAATLERQKQSIPSAVLRSLDDLDGDFELQAPAAGGSKGVLVPPWVYDGPIAVTTDAQSPFKNLHPSGRVGASVSDATHGYRIAQALHPTRQRERGGILFVNVDFRVGTNGPGARGTHRFWMGAQPAVPAVEVLVTQETLSLRTGDQIEILRALQPGQWHNLQLTINLTAGTVSGRVGLPGDVVAFDARPLAPAWTGVFDFVAFDAASADGNSLAPLALDNLGVQEFPLAPVSITPTALAVSDVAGPNPSDPGAQLRDLLVNGPFDLTYGVSEGTPRDARIQLRGEPDKPGDEVPRGFLQALGGSPLPPGTPGSGRLELAEWLTLPTHPLTARVMVNRIWQYHFGQGLVKTPNDFGTRGQPPTHPELLDYLTTEFLRSGWSIKALHRLIMASAVYQQESQWSLVSGLSPVGNDEECPNIAGEAPRKPATAIVSLSTDYFSPFPRRRLGAEETRDEILLVSGELDSRPGGAHPFPSPVGWGYTQHGPFSAVYDSNRRSVYLMTQRIKRHPFLALFDGADPNSSTPARRVTTVPTQALYFLNDPFVHESAEKFAARVAKAGSTETDRIHAAYRCALGRSATATETARAAEFLAAYRAELRSSGMESPADPALAALARVLFGSNEFLTVD